jgi:hypothetical protein
MPFYFSKAQNADPTEARTWISKMKQLVNTIEPMCPDSGISPTQYEAAALLGRWYADQGELKQAHAKIHPFVKEGICDLTDQDNSNDYDTYNNLAQPLLCFGDRPNAAIAWAFTKPLRSAQELMEDGLQSNADWDMTSALDVQAILPQVCHSASAAAVTLDAIEWKPTSNASSMCEVCVDVPFCDECHQKLMDGTANFRICNPTHPLFEIYPPRSPVTKDAEGYKGRP